MDTAEFQESSSITFEWTLRGLKNLFESRYVCGCDVLRIGCEEGLTPFQQGRNKVESNEEYEVWWGTVAGSSSRVPTTLCITRT